MAKGEAGTTEHVQPVAYDAEGRPLYAAPIEQIKLKKVRPTVAEAANISDASAQMELEDAKRKHDESVVLYPELDLSSHEFVIGAIKRHPIGVIIPMAVTIGLIGLTVLGILSYPTFLMQNEGTTLPGEVPVTLTGLLLIVLFGLVGYAAVWIYLKNTLFLTNEGLIQVVRLGLFSKREHTIELSKIEDVSFRQIGILQLSLDYGTICLSTVGDETTYQLQYVESPKQQLASVTALIEKYRDAAKGKEKK